MIPRRGFLAVVAGTLGAAFLPKAKAEKKFVLPVKPPPAAPVFSEFKGSFATSTMAHVTSGSKIVVCDKPFNFMLDGHVAGRGIPVGSRIVMVSSGGSFFLDRPAAESCYTLVTVDPAKCFRDYKSEALWNAKHF